MDYIGNKNSAINFVNEYDNLVVVRSFSKAYGMAGLRVGYGVFSEPLIEYYDKVNLPFRISSISSHVIKKILESQGNTYIEEIRKKMIGEKEKLISGLEDDFIVSVTDPRSPILVIGKKDKNIDLEKYFFDKRIITESGEDFTGLSKNYVRIRVPKNSDEFLKRLKKN